MYVIIDLLRFYPRLTSPFSVGDFYRGCQVCLLVLLPMFALLNSPLFLYSIFMVDISQGLPLTVVLSIAKLAAGIDTRLQSIVDVQRSVVDILSSVLSQFIPDYKLGGCRGSKDPEYVPGSIPHLPSIG